MRSLWNKALYDAMVKGGSKEATTITALFVPVDSQMASYLVRIPSAPNLIRKHCLSRYFVADTPKCRQCPGNPHVSVWYGARMQDAKQAINTVTFNQRVLDMTGERIYGDALVTGRYDYATDAYKPYPELDPNVSKTNKGGGKKNKKKPRYYRPAKQPRYYY